MALECWHRLTLLINGLIKQLANIILHLTAYNLAFDKSKCLNTGIDLSGFNSEFCLWQAAVGNICNTKKFRQFALSNHAFQ